ncbi:electron transport complex subunit RsxG [Thalassotalea euphylliae]|uniref:electron transport complex subunit RsxG n=1 Tax=Thalassotalea euphylliae TaxID=1655234 RepID=UPI0036452B02
MKIAIQSNAQILALFAMGATALVGITHALTADKIKSQEQKELLSTLHAIVPDEAHDNDMSSTCTIINDPLLGTSEDQIAYLATMQEKPVAAAMTTVAPDGYSGKIYLIVAMNMDGSVSGVRTLKHKETPGLGDKIEERKSDWITLFSGQPESLIESPRWAVEKDGGVIDQFTGATITPRAVVNAIKNTAQYFKQNKDKLFDLTNACGVSDEVE